MSLFQHNRGALRFSQWRHELVLIGCALSLWAFPDLTGVFADTQSGQLQAQVAAPGLPPARPGLPSSAGERGRTAPPAGNGGFSPGGEGTPKPFSPGGGGTPKGVGPSGPGGQGSPIGQPGAPGGVGTPGGGSTGGAGGAGGGTGGPGPGAGGGGGGLPPLGPAPGGRTRRDTRSGNADDDWGNWWRLNELYELGLDRRYRDRNVQTEVDGDLFLGGDISPSRVKPVSKAASAVSRRATPVLKDMLNHKNAIVRAEAVLALGRLGGADEVSLIVPRTKDGSRQVRKQAIFALGMTQSSRAYPYLRRLLKDATTDDIERAFAAIALGVLGDSRATDDLIKISSRRSQPQEVKAAALYSLGSMRNNRARVHLEYFVLRPLNNDRLRAAALQGLASSGFSGLSRTFETLLTDPDVHVRRSAAIGIGQLSFQSSYRAQLEAKEAEFAEVMRSEAFGAPSRRVEFETFLAALKLRVEKDESRLELMRDDAVRALAKRVRKDSDVMVRNFGLLALGRLGGPVARKQLSEMLDSSRSQSSKAFSALAIALNGHEDLVELLRYRAKSARLDPTSRAAVLLGLGLVEDLESRPFMRKQLKSAGDTRLLESTITALGLLGPTDSEVDAKRLLGLASRKSRPGLRRELGAALSLMGEDAIIEMMARRLKRHGPVVTRVSAAEALALCPDLRAVDALVASLKKSRVKDAVQSAIARALGRVGEKGDVPIASEFFRNLNYLMRFRALNEASTL